MYVKFKGDRVEEVKMFLDRNEIQDRAWTDRRDWTSFETVQTIASYLTAMTGKSYVPCDRGPSVSPRFDVVLVPCVGDKISFAINGDYYPDGVITRVTKSLRVISDSGRTYRRVALTAGWVQTGGYCSLVRGHRDEQNPHV